MPSEVHRRDTNSYLLYAKLDNLASIRALLRAVSFCEKVNIFACETGLKFSVEEGKYVQASAFMQAEWFQVFRVKEHVSFKLTVKALLECLKMFSTESKTESFNETTVGLTLTMIYQKYGFPLELIMEQSGVFTQIEFRVEDADELMEFETEDQCEIMFKGEPFKELLAEQDANGHETILIRIYATDIPRLVIDGVGTAGRLNIEIPYQCEMVESWDCATNVYMHYKSSVLRNALRGLQLTQKAKLKISKDGILYMSFLLPLKLDSFVEVYCMPYIVEDSESSIGSW